MLRHHHFSQQGAAASVACVRKMTLEYADARLDADMRA